MSDVAPACEDTVAGDDWRPATPRDLKKDPGVCQYCFRGVETVDAIDEPVEHLVVCDGQWASDVHVHEDHGEPTYNTTTDQSLLADTLADPEVGPEDLGLSPIEGGDL
jgi:hypothetical protein